MNDTAQATKVILLVDDDPDFLFQQKLQVEGAGFKVLTADTEEAAKEIIKNEKFDLAVVDLIMDNMDAGFTLCYHIKAKDPNIPAVLVTSVNNITDLKFDTATGEEKSWIKADAFLDKPIRFEQLKLEIDRLLKI